jgi:hypothetical protein
MAHLAQSDFTRLARGAQILGRQGGIEPIIGGISSVARCAVREVHRASPAAAMSYFNSKTARWALSGGSVAAAVRTYHDSLAQYIAWNASTSGVDLDVGLRLTPIGFGPGKSVRALAHVVCDPSGGQREARVLLWDDPPVDAKSAEIIALPVVERIENEYGTGTTGTVEVWQLAQPERIAVSPAAAQARRTAVQNLL